MTETILFFLVASSVTITSSNNEFSAEVVYHGATELAVQAFTLYGRTHEIIYRKEMLRVNTFFIHDSGGVFALNESELYFFRKDGEEFFLRDLTYPNGFGFAEDGSLFFASDKNGIFAYSMGGEPIYQFCPGRLFTGVENGRRVAIISTDTLFLYEDGVLKQVESLSTPYARRVRFTDGAGSVIIECAADTVVIGVQTGSGDELE